ncbi:MAG: sigma-70 family RNA polymerase sigma factor [Clostridia bacterium]|nr:sigma-70 family RNA polymerase sigma factor [Clostridia bacterium]MBP3294064.1 sigma-70 family RNA polymerase sigma factor [Clostridia bacterium]
MFTLLIDMLSVDPQAPPEELHAPDKNVDALVKRAKSGDTNAFSEIVTCYERFVYNTACRVLTASGLSVADADDIAQDSLIKAWRSLSTFRGECSFSTWLFRVTVNTARDVIRTNARRPVVSLTRSEDDDEEPEIWDVPVTSGDEIPEEAAERRETIEAVRRAVESLPDDQRQAIVLRDIHGLPYDEISRILGAEVGTIKSRINRGRTNLKKILKNGNFFPSHDV